MRRRLILTLLTGLGVVWDIELLAAFLLRSDRTRRWLASGALFGLGEAAVGDASITSESFDLKRDPKLVAAIVWGEMEFLPYLSRLDSQKSPRRTIPLH